MSKRKKVFAAVLAAAVSFCLFCPTAFAVTDQEVRDQVAAAGKAAVAGNVFIWFLCAIAFLKVSQKIDSFLSSLGLNVGRTGGSLLGEAMIALRGLGGLSGFGGRHGGVRSANAGSGQSRMLSGGFMGAAGRGLVGSAAQAAVSAPNTSGRMGGGLGGALYSASVKTGGSFANSVIGAIAAGSIPATGPLTGSRAAEALHSYLGYATLENSADPAPSFSEVEIGGGRITGTETSAEHPDGITFGMYHAGQYAAPEGSYSTIHTADGAAWYKQYAVDAVNRVPYKAPDGSIAYNESLVKKLPRAPQRKDRL